MHITYITSDASYDQKQYSTNKCNQTSVNNWLQSLPLVYLVKPHQLDLPPSQLSFFTQLNDLC